MNKIIITGNITKTPEVATSSNGKSYAKLSVAVRKNYPSEDGTDTNYFNCVCFGKTADNCGKYLSKGSRVLISGELNNNVYEKDGVKKYSNIISINEIEYLSSPNHSKKDNEKDSETLTNIEPIQDTDLPF